MAIAVGSRDAGNGWRRWRDAGGVAPLNHRLMECDPCRGQKHLRHRVCPSVQAEDAPKTEVEAVRGRVPAAKRRAAIDWKVVPATPTQDAIFV